MAQSKENPVDRMIVSIDLVSGANCEIYSLSEKEILNDLILTYTFSIREDDSLIVQVYHRDTYEIEYRKVHVASNNEKMEEKLWKTSKYEYSHILQYNEYGVLY